MTDPHAPGKRMGKGMLYAAWILVLVMLTLGFNQWFVHERNPNRNVHSMRAGDAIEVTLRQNRYGHYAATGAINGHPVEFLLDTGATEVSVPERVAARIGLARGASGKVNTANGLVTTYATRIVQLRLGDIVLEDVRAHINPGMRGEEVLLGMSALKALEFTQRDGMLTLRQLQ